MREEERDRYRGIGKEGDRVGEKREREREEEREKDRERKI